MEKETSEIAKLTDRIAKDPKSKLFVPLAEEYKKAGDLEMAIHVLTEGLKSNPGYITARSSLGRLLLERGDLAGAQKELEEVIKAIPDNLLAQRKLGEIYILQGRGSDALQRFRTCLTLNPGDKELTSLIADLEAGRDVVSKIPKPKVLMSLGTAPADVSVPPAAGKAPSAALTEKPVTPALSETPAAEPPKPPAEQRGEPLPAGPAPGPLQSNAVISPEAAVPAPPMPEPALRNEAEVAEEIVELEEVEAPAEEGMIELEEPVVMQEPADDLPLQETVTPSDGLFELSEAVAEAVPAPEEEPVATWAAEHPSARQEKAPAPEESSDDINTNTLADLYIAQGFYEKAIEIYQGMLADDPENIALQKKVAEIRAMEGAAGTDSAPMRESPADVPLPQTLEPSTPLPAPVQEAAQVEAPTAPASEPAAAMPKERAETAGERMQSPDAMSAPVEILPESSMSSTPQADAGGESSPPHAAQDAAARRQATIVRLESWLKNVIKEKP